jgi:hypothetical protein
LELLVTGAAGFIGSNFVRMIARGDLKGISGLKVLDKLTYAGIEANLDSVADLSRYEFVRGDICDPIEVSELLKGVDGVINFAAESHVDRSISGATDFVQTNIVGVQVILDAIKDVRNISDTSTKQAIKILAGKLVHFSKTDIESLIKLSMSYPPRARALLGAIIEEKFATAFDLSDLKSSLNPTTVYKLKIKDADFPTIKNWNIK